MLDHELALTVFSTEETLAVVIDRVKWAGIPITGGRYSDDGLSIILDFPATPEVLGTARVN